MITYHPGTPRGDDYLARWEEGNVRTEEAAKLPVTRSRFEPARIVDAAHVDHLADVASEASRVAIDLGERLRKLIGFLKQLDEADNDLRPALQARVDELMPLHEAAKVNYLVKRREYLAYVCGGTK